MRSGKDTRQAISASIDKLLMPIFLTSITTISAFLALYFAPINQLLGYGVCLSIGILYAFILSVTFYQQLYHLRNGILSQFLYQGKYS